MSFYPTRNRECQKHSKKIKKIEKHHNGLFIAKISGERLRKIEKKNRFDEFLPEQE